MLRTASRRRSHSLYGPKTYTTQQTMRYFALLCLTFLALPVPAQAQFEKEEIKATIQSHCRSEWPNDFRMRRHCQEQQRKGVRELARLSDSNGGIPKNAFQTAFSGCVREWPEDYRMMAHCLQQQIKGYDETERGAATSRGGATSSEKQTIKSHCKREWPDDFRMQSHCEEQQMKGLRFLKDRPSYVSASKWRRVRSHCRSEWRGDFRMQAYCTRQQLGL